MAERVLPLSGIHNFRDYGGYAVEGGGRLREGVLWRSAHHEAATDEDLAALDALRLETIIDLRGDDERELHPCRRLRARGGHQCSARRSSSAQTSAIRPEISRRQAPSSC